MKKKIILDCDPGHDDAVAIILAGRSSVIDLLGITVVAGNQTLEKTGINTLNLCQYLGIEVPVCLGAKEPLIKPIQVCPDIHGETGLDGFDFPKLTKEFDKRSAVDFIVQTILNSHDKITLITTGPMTNLALALKLYPDIKANIEEVVLMGGSIANGNVTPAAEYNIYADPEAAYIVFNSGLKVTMFGLDVTRKVMVLPQVIARMGKINNKVSKLFVDLMRVYNLNQNRVFNIKAGPLHDPVTIAYLINPKVVKIAHVNCDIDISHSKSYGRTNCDMFDYLKLDKNAYVAHDIDVEMYWDIVENGIKQYSDL